MITLNHCIVIGAGTMGRGIAQWFLQQGLTVELVDQNYEFGLKSIDLLHASLESLVAKKKMTQSESDVYKKNLSLKRIEDINKNADIVIEAIIEDKGEKQKLFSYLDSHLNEKTILASNTSSFPITELAVNLSLIRKKSFLGLHFFNPATIMKLVEVINSKETDLNLSQFLVHWFNERGKVACQCSDSPGFIVNRVARNFYGESLRALGSFESDRIKEIDLVMREVGGFKMGPFELMDLIGIDINLSVTESVYKAFFDEARFKPHRIQKDLVNAGHLGIKTKKGFYQYDK